MKMLIFAFYFMAVTVTRSLSQNNTLEKREAIVFPGQNVKKQEIPLALVRRINDKGIDDFIDGITGHEQDNQTIEISARFGMDDIERSAVRSAKLAVCTPELTTVPIVSEKDSTVFYYPSCTRVQRCGGCCGHQALSCQPVESEIIQLSVITAEYKGGSQLTFRNREIVSVEQHNKCKCDCRVQPEHCSKFQKYNKEMCRCECENRDDEEKCKNERNLKLWNRDLCSCVCREELECGSGYYFDPFFCRCEAIRWNDKQKQNWNFDFRRGFYSPEARRFRQPKQKLPQRVRFWID